MAGLIRTTHPYGFRSGKWAKLRGTIEFPPNGSAVATGDWRPCYVAEFSDGVVDFWVISDRDGRYEFA